MNNSFDAIIVGAGINGTSTAFQLLRHGLKNVLILEKAGQVAAGSTGSSSAVLRARYSTHEMSVMAKEGLEAYFNWEDFLEIKNPKCTAHQTGVLWMMNEDSSTINEEIKKFQGLGITMQPMDLTQFRESFPSISPCQRHFDLTGEVEHECEDSNSFLWEPYGGYADPEGANWDLLQAALDRGATIKFKTRVTDIIVEGHAIKGVRVASGDTFYSNTVINASGPWCMELIRKAGFDFSWNLQPTRIQCCVRDSPEAFRGTLPVFAELSGGIYGRAEAGGGQILFGSILPEDEEERVEDPDDFKTSCDPDFRDSKLHAIHHRFPSCHGRGNATGYAALYTVNTDDMHPIIDESPLRGFYLCNGFSGHGFKLAPATGSLLAQLITGNSLEGDCTLDPQFLSLGRTPIHLKTKNVLA